MGHDTSKPGKPGKNMNIKTQMEGFPFSKYLKLCVASPILKTSDKPSIFVLLRFTETSAGETLSIDKKKYLITTRSGIYFVHNKVVMAQKIYPIPKNPNTSRSDRIEGTNPIPE